MEKTLEIPRVTNTTIKYYVNGEYIDNVTMEEVNKMRENVLEHIVATKDASILNRFYFVGHKDSNDKMGEPIKITMNSLGDFSDVPWEMSHIRRSIVRILRLEADNHELLKSFTDK